MTESRTTRPQSVFATTHWTQVLATRGESPAARSALSDLCSAYYEPVVAFLRARFGNEDQARELAHDFFARLLERNSLSGAEPRRGRFRSYLLGAVKHFVADQQDRERAAKRGAGVEHLTLAPGTDTSPGLEPADPALRGPALIFDRQWALTLLGLGLGRLGEELAADGRGEQFEVLKPWLTGTAAEPQAEAAARLGVNEGAVKVAIHRLRKRFREPIKEEIARTVGPDADVQEEMVYLLTVLSS